MNDPLEKDFQALFAKETTIKVDDPMWQQLEIDLQRKEFYQFSFFHFNIYYALMMFSSILLSGVMLYDYSNKSPIRREHTVIQKDTDTIVVTKNVYIENKQKTPVILSPTSSKSKTENKVNYAFPLKKENTTIEANAVLPKQESQNIIEINTEKPKQEPKEIIPAQELPNPITSPIIVHHQDTIVELDSVKISRRKMRKLKE